MGSKPSRRRPWLQPPPPDKGVVGHGLDAGAASAPVSLSSIIDITLRLEPYHRDYRLVATPPPPLPPLSLASRRPRRRRLVAAPPTLPPPPSAGRRLLAAIPPPPRPPPDGGSPYAGAAGVPLVPPVPPVPPVPLLPLPCRPRGCRHPTGAATVSVLFVAAAARRPLFSVSACCRSRCSPQLLHGRRWSPPPLDGLLSPPYCTAHCARIPLDAVLSVFV